MSATSAYDSSTPDSASADPLRTFSPPATSVRGGCNAPAPIRKVARSLYRHTAVRTRQPVLTRKLVVGNAPGRAAPSVALLERQAVVRDEQPCVVTLGKIAANPVDVVHQIAGQPGTR